MTEKYTTQSQLQCMNDLRTSYIHGSVIWQCNDKLKYAVFGLLVTIPCILDWLLCYICDFPIKVYSLRPTYIYIFKIPALVSLKLRFQDVFRLLFPGSAEKFRWATYCTVQA